MNVSTPSSLQGDAVGEGAEVVPEVKVPGRTVAGEDAEPARVDGDLGRELDGSSAAALASDASEVDASSASPG